MVGWALQFEGEHGATELVGLAVDAKGDVALAGHILEEGGVMDGRRDAVVMKLASTDGGILWTKILGVKGAHDWSSAVAADPEGNFLVCGQTDGELFAKPVGAGQDIWAAKFGRDGTPLWEFQVGSSGQDVASALAVDTSTGDAVVCGSTTGALFPRRTARERLLGRGDSTDGRDKDPHDASQLPGGQTESFCAKLGADDGRMLWGKRLSGGINDGLLAAAVDPKSGDIFAAGFTSYGTGMGMSDYLVVRLAGDDGWEVWRRTGGGGWKVPHDTEAYVQDSASALALDRNGDVVIAGNTAGALFGSPAAGGDTDVFVEKIRGANGSHIWGWQEGSGGNDYANDVTIDPNGDVYACGSASPGLFDGGGGGGTGGAGWNWAGDDGWDFTGSEGGDGAATSPRRADLFVAKLNGGTGGLVWGEQFGSGADDHAVGLVVGPIAGSDAAASGGGSAKEVSKPPGEATDVDSEPARGRGGDSALYLTGWTRGALYSSIPAKWQDGWAVKLSNPPPKTLGVSGSTWRTEAGASAVDYLPRGEEGANKAAADAARGAVTVGFVGTVIGMVAIVSSALCLVLRRANVAGGALSVVTRHESTKALLGRRRLRASGSDAAGSLSGVSGLGIGATSNSHSSERDGSVELTLLSEGGDGGGSSPISTRHGAGGGMSGAGGTTCGGRRDSGKSPGTLSVRPNTFYL